MAKQNDAKMIQDRLLRIFNETIEEGEYLDKELDEIDGFSEIFKMDHERIYKFLNSNLCMFKYRYNGEDSVLVFIFIPVNANEDDNKSKHVSERIMESVKHLEETFISLDYLNIIPGDQNNCVVAIKSVEPN